MQITIREPGSAITHYIGMVLSLFAAAPLLVLAYISNISYAVAAMFIFTFAITGLYLASTLYHTVNVKEKFLFLFKKIDHMMIFVLIAGTYTPICLLVLKGRMGITLLIVIWGLAILGMTLKAFWVTCPRWFSSIIYIAMGWACLAVFPALYDSLPTSGFYWLLAGGIAYTVGGIIYAMKFKKLNQRFKYFGSHEIFHLFVMLGSFCHFATMFTVLMA
ncbi:MAG: PAQR family membrane homeostasis protein TrhA [Lachnospiraceae bacterium]